MSDDPYTRIGTASQIAADVVEEHVDGPEDTLATILAMVLELTTRGKLTDREHAILIRSLVDTFPVGAGHVRTFGGNFWGLRNLQGYSCGYIRAVEDPRTSSKHHQEAFEVNSGNGWKRYSTQEEAQRMLIAAQPAPEAVIQFGRESVIQFGREEDG